MNPLFTQEAIQSIQQDRLREAAAWRRAAALPARPARWRVRTGTAVERLGARIARRRDTAPVQPVGPR